MNLPEFLNKKFIEWQYQSGERKTLDEFADYLRVNRPLLSMWMNGSRRPGTKFKGRIIELYGDEAAEVLGEDPRLFFINEHWDEASEELQRSIHKQLQKEIKKNDAQRVSKRREKTDHQP